MYVGRSRTGRKAAVSGDMYAMTIAISGKTTLRRSKDACENGIEGLLVRPTCDLRMTSSQPADGLSSFIVCGMSQALRGRQLVVIPVLASHPIGL